MLGHRSCRRDKRELRFICNHGGLISYRRRVQSVTPPETDVARKTHTHTRKHTHTNTTDQTFKRFL